MEQVDWQIGKSTSECNKYILEKEVDCDVSFKVGEDKEVIKGHKFNLRIRSPVFERMFSGSFCESEKDPVIPDVSPAAFRALLRYCYYECLDIGCDIALSVLYAATKYMLPILETAARKTLIQKLDDSKIWDVCKYSTDVGDKELYAGCITYMKDHLTSSNILDVIKYAVTTKDTDLHDCCKTNLPCCLSASNIWDVYKYGLDEGNTEVSQFCKEFFVGDISTVREALKSEEFQNISYEILLDMLHVNDRVDEAVGIGYTPGISISEIELFNACNAWAEAECRRQEIDPTGANKRTLLQECLPLIRFPNMLQKDLDDIVYPTGILTPVEITNLKEYICKGPGSECPVDFPSKERQFVVTPAVSTWGKRLSKVYIKSDVRVMLSRVWTLLPGQYRVSVMDEKTQTFWCSLLLDAKHDNHFAGDHSKQILQYLDIEPQVLEAGTRYHVEVECIQQGTSMDKQPGVEYIMIPGKSSPYKEVKITPDNFYNFYHIYSLTLSLV